MFSFYLIFFLVDIFRVKWRLKPIYEHCFSLFNGFSSTTVCFPSFLYWSIDRLCYVCSLTGINVFNLFSPKNDYFMINLCLWIWKFPFENVCVCVFDLKERLKCVTKISLFLFAAHSVNRMGKFGEIIFSATSLFKWFLFVFTGKMICILCLDMCHRIYTTQNTQLHISLVFFVGFTQFYHDESMSLVFRFSIVKIKKIH